MTKKNTSFEGWSWPKFNNLGLAVATNFIFYTSVAKGLKPKVGKFWGLIPTFVEVTEEKLVGEDLNPPLSWIRLRKPRVEILVSIIKVVTVFIKTIFKDSKKVKRIRNYVSKCNLFLYFLIQQNLMTSSEKMLMSAEL